MTKNKEQKNKQESITKRWEKQSEVPILIGKKKIHKRKEKDRIRVK